MKNPSSHFYEFDSFRVDPAERVLFRDGHPVQLSPKLFETLLVLVRNSGHITEKEDLIRKVWPDTFVEENNLSQHISALRKILSDDRHEQRYIETVPRRGYRFKADVREMWTDDHSLVSATHTKMSMLVREETEEIEEVAGGALRPTADTQPVLKRAQIQSQTRFRLAAISLAVLILSVSFAFVFNRLSGQRPVVAQSPLALQKVPSPPFAITVFNPVVWPRPDPELGITGFVIEDFEDTTLAEGLTIELTDSDNNFGPTGTLPMTFTPAKSDVNKELAFIPGVWDGARVLLNRREPPPLRYRDFAWGDMTFHTAGGASSFGFSLEDMDLDTELFVNGASYGNLKKYLPSGAGRNGYLRIDVTGNEPIVSVKVANTATFNTGDALIFDHVAFNPINR